MFGKENVRDVYLIRTKGVTPGWPINWHLESFASKRNLSKSVSGKTYHLSLATPVMAGQPTPLNVPPQKANPNPFHFKHLSSFHGDSWWSPGNLGRKKNWGEAKDAQNVLPGFICPDVRSYYLKKNACIVAGMSLPRGFWDKRLSTSELRIPDPSRRQYGSRTCNFWRVFFLRSRVWKFLQTADE